MAADWTSAACSRAQFVARVNEQGALHYRDLPWRRTRDPYAIWVSEVMLQQTQVSRVQNRWMEWMRAFPTVESLARAQTPDVLMLWMGLGYNRRALNLKRACEVCFRDFAGEIPNSEEDLRSLPGIGPATAEAIVARLAADSAAPAVNVTTGEILEE